MLLASLDGTIVGTAMPKVISDLHGMEYYAWPFTAYMLCSTTAIPIFGKLADIYGRKPIYFIGVVVFLLGSTLSGLSQSMMQLIVFRGLQGIGGGILMSNAMQIVGEIFPPRERGKYMGIITSMFGLASIFGPALGGFIADNLNWRWIFYVNLPVGILAMIVMFFALPYTKLGAVKRTVDYSGVFSLIVALVPMLLAVSWAGKDYDWVSPQVTGMLVFSLIALAGFVTLESRAAEPIIPLSLFKNSIFVTSILAGFLANVLMFSAVVYIPLFVQGVLGSTATRSGMVITPMLLSHVLTSILVGQIISRTGKYRLLAILSFVISILGMTLLSRMGVVATNSQVVVSMIVLGIGIGITMPVFSISVQNAFPRSQVGVVTSSLLQNPQALTNPDTINAVKANIPQDAVPYFNSLMAQVKAVLATSIQNVFDIGIFIAAAGLITVLFLKEIELNRSFSEPALERIESAS